MTEIYDYLKGTKKLILIDVYEKVWLKGKQACENLGIIVKDYDQIIRRDIDEDQKINLRDIELGYKLIFKRNEGATIYISIQAFYGLSFTRKTPEAKKFSRWVENTIEELRKKGYVELENKVVILEKQLDEKDSMFDEMKQYTIELRQNFNSLKNAVQKGEMTEELREEMQDVKYNSLEQCLILQTKCTALEKTLALVRKENKSLKTQIDFMVPKTIQYVEAKTGYFYILQVSPKYIGLVLSNFYKPGITTKTMKSRMNQYGCGNLKQRLVAYFAINSNIDLRLLESKVLENLEQCRLKETNEIVKIPFEALLSLIRSMIMLVECNSGIYDSKNEYIPVNVDLVLDKQNVFVDLNETTIDGETYEQ